MELITICDIWPSGFYNGDIQDTINPPSYHLQQCQGHAEVLREHVKHNGPTVRGYATVMTKDINSIPLDGIWRTSEFSTPKTGGKRGESIHTVLAVGAKGQNSKTVWEHPKDDLENCRSKRTLVSRQGVKRYKPEQLQDWFVFVAF